MKKLSIIFSLILSSYFAFSQTPQSFKYQAVARDVSGNEYVNTLLNVRGTIHDSISGGNILYQETFIVTTNQFGLFSIDIGQGLVVTGNFSTINWGLNNKFLQIEVNFGAGYQNMGTAQLLSVPYALYSANSSNAANATNVIPHGKQKFTANGIFTVPAGVTTVWVSMCGGGGGGCVFPSSAGFGGGGGGADAINDTPVTVTPAQNILVTIGVGGSSCSNGTASSFGSLTTNGGGGGNSTGGGGGSGGSGGSAGNSGGSGSSPIGGGCIFGSGGLMNGYYGNNGSGYGAGGAGAYWGATPGSGSNGFVLVEW